MTKKLTISVPDDVAERLAQEEDVSDFVAQLVRAETPGEVVRRRHQEAGYHVPEERVDAAREERQRIEAAITPEFRAEAEEFAAKLRARRSDAIHPIPDATPA
jgi:hypothetical protein